MKPRRTLGVAILLVSSWLLAVSASTRMGVTVDEIAHLASGYSYWRLGDHRLHPENGTLPMRAAALPLLALGLEDPPADTPGFRRADVAEYGRALFFELGNPLDMMLVAGRGMIALFGVLTAWLVWRWASGLFGRTAGWIALVFAVTCPALLAHGALVTSDMALTACLLAALSAFWRLIHVVTWGRIAIATLACGAVLLAKASGVLAAPMLVLMMAVRWIRPAPLVLRLGTAPRWIRSRAGVFGATTGLAVAVAAGSLGILWAGYGFRYSGFGPGATPADQYYFTWPQILSEEPLPPNDGGSGIPSQVLQAADPTGPTTLSRTIAWFRDHRLLPEAYLWGFAHTHKFSRARPAFLNGEYRTTGWPQFFPLAFLMKTTLPALLFGLGGFALLASRAGTRGRRGRVLHRAAPLLILFVVYWAVAVTTKLNIGHRHILPVYPVLYVFAGAAGAWLLSGVRGRPGRIALGVAVLAHGADSFAARPYYLSYFNAVAGGISGGWRHLVDSSYDWGQGLPALEEWLGRKSDDEAVHLSYFGSDSPRARRLPVNRFGDDLSDYGARNYPMTPRGGWFVIGATHFQRVYLHLAGPWTREREELYRAVQARLLGRAPGAGDGMAGPDPTLLRDAQDYELLMFGRICHYLSEREPDTILGGSLLVFHLTDSEVGHALNAPFEEFQPAPRQRTPGR